MPRTFTPHRVMTEGRTGRKIGRNLLRGTLGNPKHRAKDMDVLAEEWFSRGFLRGAQAQCEKVELSTCMLSYGEGYVVEPVTEEVDHGIISTETITR
jgi:hypothetical protein